MSRATFNRVTYLVVELAKKEGLPLEAFTVHDLRRTGSTLLNEVGFNSDWIEKCLAHEHGRSSRGVYNKAEYEVAPAHDAGMVEYRRRMGSGPKVCSGSHPAVDASA
jgi:integrase